MAGRKILGIAAGAIVALGVLAGAAYFFVQQRIHSNIESGFRQFAENPPPPYRNVTFGKIAFTLYDRRVVIEDFAASAGEAGDRIVVARLELENFDSDVLERASRQSAAEDRAFHRLVDKVVASKITVVQSGRTFDAKTFTVTELDIQFVSPQTLAGLHAMSSADRVRRTLSFVRLGSLSVTELRGPAPQGEVKMAQVDISGLRDDRFKSLVLQGLTVTGPDGKSVLGRFELRDGLSAAWFAPDTRKSAAERLGFLDFSSLKIADFHGQWSSPTKPEASISSLEIGPVDAKRLGSFVMNGLSMSEKGPEPITVKIGRFELRDVDWEQVLPLVAELSEEPDLSRDSVRSKLERIGMLRYSVGKLSFTGMEFGPGISMAELSLRGANDNGTGDADMAISDFVMKAADLENRNVGAGLTAFGYGTLALSLRMRAVSNAGASTAALEKLEIFGPQVGQLTASYGVSNYRPATSPAEDPLAVLLAANVDFVEVGWQDEGLTQRALAFMARQQRTSITQLKSGLALQLRQSMLAFGNSPRLTELSDALLAYLDKPGALAISVKPPKPVPVVDMVTLLNGTPPDLPALFELLAVRTTRR
jgi:hypothetical protein